MSHELASWLRYYRELGFTHLYRHDSAGFIASFEGEAAASLHATAVQAAEPSRDREGAVPIPPKGATLDRSRDRQSNLVTPAVPPVASPILAAPLTAQQPATLFAGSTPRETLDAIREDLGDCRRCKLSMGRKSIVFGSGNPKAELVFVGEGPGADEDEQGLPFVGRAGQLLTEMIEKGMKIPRPDVYICNIIKCRPPQNRKPEKDEVDACRKFVERQLDAIHPRVICALGATAAETLLGVRQSMGSLRGQWFEFHGFPLAVTYHPAFLLRDPTKKRDSWADLKMILEYLKK